MVILAIPLSHQPTYQALPVLEKARSLLEPFLDKTNLGPLRWLHFVALAILIPAVIKSRPQLMAHLVSKALIKMGQQSLPIFY